MKGINVLPFGSNLRGVNLPSRSLFSGFSIPSLGGKSDKGLFTKPLTPSQGGTDLSLGDAVLNMVTGNADYMRTLESMDIQNAFNAAEAEKSRDWQEYMRDTSLTSTINQLKENGLNPFLAYNSASVSTPSTSSAHSGSVGSFSSRVPFALLYRYSIFLLGKNVPSLSFNIVTSIIIYFINQPLQIFDRLL